MGNVKKISSVFFTLLLTLSLSLSVLSRTALAGDATLYLSPGSGTKYVGSTFSVAVKVNSGSHTTNAYKAVVKFPTNLLTATSASVGGSICTLQITGSPSYSNSAGTANFECGHPGSFSGTSGTIGTITFSVKAAGTAALSFTTANVKAADGSGTEVLGSTSEATYSLQPAPVTAPAVSSATHPDQNSWYAQRDATLSWTRPSGAVDFSYTLNQNPNTVPNDISDGTGTARSYQNLSDGVYYFHIKARGAGGWGETAHFRIQIDTAPPDPFELISIPSADNVTAAPLIIADAIDRTSGISHYELSFDEGPFETVTMPYQFPRISEGTHTVAVRAFDRAGNYREATLMLYVPDIDEPTITNPADGSYLPILEKLEIRGTAPQGFVELYLNDEFLALVESDGEFSYTHTDFLRPGSYTVTAKSVTEGGVESAPVTVRFTVDPRAVSLFGLNLPGWLVYSLLLGLIVGMIILLILLLKKRRNRERHFLKDLERIENEVDKILGAEEEELDRAIEKALKGSKKTRILNLERKVEKVEGEAKRKLIKELDAIKRHHQTPRSNLFELTKRKVQSAKNKTKDKAKLIGEKLKLYYRAKKSKLSRVRKRLMKRLRNEETSSKRRR